MGLVGHILQKNHLHGVYLSWLIGIFGHDIIPEKCIPNIRSMSPGEVK